MAISYSQAVLFAACPARYKAERIDGIKAEESLPMKQGSFLHAVLEEYSNRLIERGGGRAPDIADRVFEGMWPQSGLPEIVKEDCRHLVAVTAKAVVLHPENVVGVELRVALDAAGQVVDWDAPEAVVRGILDRLELQEGPEGPTMIVWDYKSGRTIDNPKESQQLPLYAALALAIEPNPARIIGRYYYPRHGAERSADISQEGARAALKWALEIHRRVEDLKRDGEFGVWPATPGAGCKECPIYWACETRKKAAERMLEVPRTEEEAAALMARLDVLLREISESKEVLKLFVEANGPIEASGLVAEILAAHRYQYPLKDLRGVLAKHGLDPDRYLKGDTRAIQKAIVKYPGLEEDLAAVRKDSTSTSLKIRKFGKEPQGDPTDED